MIIVNYQHSKTNSLLDAILPGIGFIKNPVKILSDRRIVYLRNYPVMCYSIGKNNGIRNSS